MQMNRRTTEEAQRTMGLSDPCCALYAQPNANLLPCPISWKTMECQRQHGKGRRATFELCERTVHGPSVPSEDSAEGC